MATQARFEENGYKQNTAENYFLDKKLKQIQQDRELNAAMTAEMFCQWAIEQQEEEKKDKEMVLEMQRAKAKQEEEERARQEELDYLKAQTGEKVATAEGTKLIDLNTTVQDEINTLVEENAEIDANLETLSKDLQDTSKNFNDSRNQKTKTIESNLANQIKSKQFLVYNLDGEKGGPFPIKDPEQFAHNIVQKAAKPLSTDIPKNNPEHVKQVNEALDEQEKLVKQGKKPKKSVEETLVDSLAVMGHIEAVRYYGEEVLGHKDMTPKDFLKLLKANPNLNNLMGEIQKSLKSKEGEGQIRNFYRTGNDYVEQSEKKDLNLDKIDYLKGVNKSIGSKLPPGYTRSKG